MNNKSLIVALLIISILILVSCTSGTKAPASGFIGGKEGINAILNIDSTSGESKVFDKGVDPFKISLNLQNKGEEDVKSGSLLVTLDGINFQAFQIRDPTQKNSIPLPGLRREAGKVTPAAQSVMQFDANYAPDEDADRIIDLSANICYQYRTTSRVSNLCLRKRITGPITDATCMMDETKVVEKALTL